MATCILIDNGRSLFTLPKLQIIANKKVLQLKNVRRVGVDLKITLSNKTSF